MKRLQFLALVCFLLVLPSSVLGQLRLISKDTIKNSNNQNEIVLKVIVDSSTDTIFKIYCKDITDTTISDRIDTIGRPKTWDTSLFTFSYDSALPENSPDDTITIVLTQVKLKRSGVFQVFIVTYLPIPPADSSYYDYVLSYIFNVGFGAGNSGVKSEPISSHVEVPFPNPANSFVSIRESSAVAIYDALGRSQRISPTVSDQLQTFDLRSLPTGQFWLRQASGKVYPFSIVR